MLGNELIRVDEVPVIAWDSSWFVLLIVVGDGKENEL